MLYRLTGTLSAKGAAPDQFRSTLRGVAVDSSRNVYVVGDREVKVFDRAGELARRWTTVQPGISVAVDDDGRIWIGESGRVEIFDPRGKLLETWSDRERLGLVTAVGFARDYVLLADARAPCIRRFTRAGKYDDSIGDGGRRNGFSAPGGYLDFVIDGEGRIRAANSGKHRVETYSVDGELLSRFGRFGMHAPEQFRGCCNPINIAMAGDGSVIVTEKAPARIKIYDPDGGLIETFGEKLLDPQAKRLALAVDRNERLLVADPPRARILVFERNVRKAPIGEPAGTQRGQ